MATKKKTAKKKATKKAAAKSIKPKGEAAPDPKKAAKPKAQTTADTLVAGRTPENWWAVECRATGDQGPTRGDIGPALTAFLDGDRAESPVKLHRPIEIAYAGSGFYQAAKARL